MDSPRFVLLGFFCVGPLLLIGLGFALGAAYARRSLLGYRLRSPFERADEDYSASPAGYELANDWQP
jgi:hypothetical protein